jgi:hypothetical protein
MPAVAIWRAVAEDYAPFDVDVTTISQDTSSAAMQYVSRACIGGDGRWFGSAGTSDIAFAASTAGTSYPACIL